MTDCKHEWMWNGDYEIPFVCVNPDCRRFLVPSDVEAMLNEHTELKAKNLRLRAYWKSICDIVFDGWEKERRYD